MENFIKRLQQNPFWEFEKLIFPELVKMFPAFLTPVRFITIFKKACHWSVSRTTLIICHTLLSCLLKIHFNPLNAKLNPTCHLLALLGAHHILHVSRIGVNIICPIYISAFQVVCVITCEFSKWQVLSPLPMCRLEYVCVFICIFFFGLTDTNILLVVK